MAFESTRNLLSSLIQQQRETELMQQTPQFQAAVDQLFANRIQFAQNQVVMDKLGRAQNNDEIWEALKTVKPEDYVKRKREQLVGGQILDLLKKSPEQERDYALLNYLSNSIGYGDVGPIEQRPVSKGRFEQELKLRETNYGDRLYGDRPDLSLRRQREAKFLELWDRGILFEGEPATEEQKSKLQEQYLRHGELPMGYDVIPEETNKLAPIVLSDKSREAELDSIMELIEKTGALKTGGIWKVGGKKGQKRGWTESKHSHIEQMAKGEVEVIPEVKALADQYMYWYERKDVEDSIKARKMNYPGQIPSLSGEQELQQRSEGEITEATAWLKERNISVTPKNIESYFTKYKK